MTPLGLDLKLAIIYFAIALGIILASAISWAVHKYVKHVFGRARRDAMTVIKGVR